MTDHQRIHPAPDVEAPPPLSPSPTHTKATAPLIPSDSTKSDDGVRGHHYPPPPTRTLPSTYQPPRHPKQRRSCCCRVFCCIFCLILFLIVAIGATIGILFLIFHPKIPKYSIDSLKIIQFTPNLNNDSLTATFAVNVTAHNPNKRIGIYYLGGSSLSAWHQDTLLCEGSLPEFYQGHHNTTVINVPLTGTVNNATGLTATVQQEQSQNGNIPLVLRARVPVKVKLGKLKLMKMKFKVKCDLSIDNLAANKDIHISSSNCSFKLKRIF